MNPRNRSFCLPDQEKSCFACCPPIRPANYEHIQYMNSVKRMLRENTLAFVHGRKDRIPITGFSCWALGYLDEPYKLVGCLLHPFHNEGHDLRYRVGYGEKCRREVCPEAKIFKKLNAGAQGFWLHLADGLDGFSYSSRKLNGLFRILGWGPEVLHLVAAQKMGRSFTRESFFSSYPFFRTRVNSRANAYLLLRLVRVNGTDLLKAQSFQEQFEKLSSELSAKLREAQRHSSGSTYTHLLNLDKSFLDFLRLAVGITRIGKKQALEMKEMIDEKLLRFRPSP